MTGTAIDDLPLPVVNLLTDALRQLTRRALASEDPNMRDVGVEFTPDEDEAEPG